ncbi:Kinase, NEK [Giardia muris]|uniref:Kinase, NEK n=1 Tax=Giardia muris TaxID=5742 RepID=A0A4Z1T2N0_GIAMU|nr:Kinase, NEK [Giardia muris]|eukprot:TNJ28203.1 Kinase, NEK [Giardia muris]
MFTSRSEFLRRYVRIDEGTVTPSECVYIVRLCGGGTLRTCREFQHVWLPQGLGEADLASAPLFRLRSLTLPHLLPLHDLFYDEQSQQLQIITDFVPTSNLQTQISTHMQSKTPIPEDVIWKVAAQISVLLHTLHFSHGLFLQYFAPRQCALMNDGSIRLVVTDLAQAVSPLYMGATSQLTRIYWAPELLEPKVPSFKSDVWSLGCTLYELCALQPFIDLPTLPNMMQKSANLPNDLALQQYSSELRAAIIGMLAYEPAVRLSSEYIAALPQVVSVVRGNPVHSVMDYTDAAPPAIAGTVTKESSYRYDPIANVIETDGPVAHTVYQVNDQIPPRVECIDVPNPTINKTRDPTISPKITALYSPSGPGSLEPFVIQQSTNSNIPSSPRSLSPSEKVDSRSPLFPQSQSPSERAGTTPPPYQIDPSRYTASTAFEPVKTNLLASTEISQTPQSWLPGGSESGVDDSQVTSLMRSVVTFENSDMYLHAPDIGCRTATGVTALMLAATVGNVDAIKYILERGLADPTCREARCVETERGWTALMYAVEAQHTAAVAALVDVESGIHDLQGQTALMHAVQRTNLEIVRILSQKEVGMVDHAGLTALAHAVDQRSCLATELVAPYEFSCPNPQGLTPLHVAAQRGDLPLVRTLSKYGTRVYTYEGQTALMLAAASGQASCIEPLIHLAGLTDKNGRTALMLGAEAGHLRVLEMLVMREAGMQDIRGQTALMYAASTGHADCLHVLIRDEARKRCTDGTTALMLAAELGQDSAVTILRDHEAGILRLTGESAISIAIAHDRPECVRLLFPYERGVICPGGRGIREYIRGFGRGHLLVGLESD